MDSPTFQVMYIPIQDAIYVCLYRATCKCYVSGEGLWDQGGGGHMGGSARGKTYNYFWIDITLLARIVPLMS